jgi:predicted ATPase with chaperone activity
MKHSTLRRSRRLPDSFALTDGAFVRFARRFTRRAPSRWWAAVRCRAPDGTSPALRERVPHAFERQLARQGKANARLGAADLERVCPRSSEPERLLAHAMARHTLSARGYHRVLKVARTIADLAGSDTIDTVHVAEAIGYRPQFVATN